MVALVNSLAECLVNEIEIIEYNKEIPSTYRTISSQVLFRFLKFCQ